MVARTSSLRSPAFLPRGLGRFFRLRLIETAGAALMLLGALLALALATYSPGDPSLNSAGHDVVANKAGLAGAFAADLLLQSTGLAGAALVLALIAWGWVLIKRHRLSLWALRLALLPLGVTAAAIGFAALPQPAAWPLAGGMGGSLGRIIAAALLDVPAAGAPAAGTPTLIAAGLLGALLFLVPALGLTAREWRTLGRGLLTSGRFTARAGAKAYRSARAAIASQAGAFQAERTVARERVEPRFGHPGVPPAFEDTPRPPVRPPVEIVEKRAPKPRQGRRGQAERQGILNLIEAGDYQLPPLKLLSELPNRPAAALNDEALAQNARLLESVLDDFGVRGEIVKVRPGPVVTLYELEPAPGTKSSRVIGLADDIARYMSAVSVRAAVIPGRNVIGIEIPNSDREIVHLRELLSTEAYENTVARLTLALGKEISGAPVTADLARMPHLLVAGTTGSGKSVAINSMILSLVYRLAPDQCRFIMIDPKMLELSVYDGIPHLLTPVVTDPTKAVVALKWTVREMEERYQLMAKLGVRNITSYNKRLVEARERDEELTRVVQTGFDSETGEPIFEEHPLDLEPLPLIVVIVDEMADLMMLSGKEVEGAIQRLSQMARAAGIHLIMATQRPSVDVITGTIKANFPTRISFQVSSKIDSRTILGEQGAEQLLGQGDMLYMEAGGRLTRVHGPFVSDAEVERIVAYLKKQARPDYLEAVTEAPEAVMAPGLEAASEDPLYDQALALVCRERKASTSFVQRHLQIGYNRAARLIERMEVEGVISPANHVGRREVLARDIDDRIR
jgi:S-DNA-T family DNA segregation ATPase FtsK/SpoIIIE